MDYKKVKLKVYFIGIILTVFASCSQRQKTLFIFANINEPQIEFAVNEIETAFKEYGIEVLVSEKENADISFSIQPKSTSIKAEGFSLKKINKKIQISASDLAGLLYGGLELAEQIKINGLENVKEIQQNPYMEKRGTKFNIPLDVRTPSYTDVSDVAQKNISEMWNFDFWKEYIDNLARYRYNYISLWSLHPFPSLVKVKGYEDVALNDVHRSTVKWKEYYRGDGVGFTNPEILRNPEIVKKISIDEKIEFWQKVMSYAKGRNIDFYIVTWNIFVDGAKGKYGITDKIDNSITRDYFRKTIKEMFVSYPDLAGIGLTTGENMRNLNFDEKENWAFETYAQGVLDAAAEMPDRKFTFIHRQHQTGALDIAKKFKPLIDNKNIDFLFSFKYAKAHVMSATKQPYHLNFAKEIKGMKTLWTLRNDDVYYYRWGAPDFVREFIRNIPTDISRGYYYGSDQWVWGREFTTKKANSPRDLEITKHWYHWMMWGRLGYNPHITNERFMQLIQHKFKEVNAAQLFTAWQEASMIYPTTTGFHWGPLDYQWYIEGCKGRPAYTQNETGFHDVNRFINLPPHPMSGFQSIPDFVEMKIKNLKSKLKTPLEVVNLLHTHSENAIKIIETMSSVTNQELKSTLHDIKTMALLGKYYAYKISGSTQLALYRKTKDKNYQLAAITELESALAAWKNYTRISMQQNINPLWTNRVGYVDWVKTIEWVANDIKIAKTN